MIKVLHKNFSYVWASFRILEAPELLLLQLMPFSTSSKRSPNTFKSDERKQLFTINYLKNALRFSPERAVSASNYMNFKTSERPDSVIAFLKNRGFTTRQILALARTFPPVLLFDLEKTLLPKFEYFQTLGLSTQEIKAMLSVAPQVLGRRSEIIQPSFEFIKGITQSHEKALYSLRRNCGILISNYLRPNIECVKEVGVPESNIVFLLMYHPKTFMVRPPKFRMIVGELKDTGLNPARMRFALGLHVSTSMNKSTGDKKVQIYKKWGWSEDEILKAFVKHPWCMMVSKDKIGAIMERLVNKLGFKSSDMLKRPIIVSLSLENRIIPRGIIYKALSEKELIPDNFSLAAFMEVTEEKFIKRLVERFESEAPELLTLYQKGLPLPCKNMKE